MVFLFCLRGVDASLLYSEEAPNLVALNTLSILTEHVLIVARGVCFAKVLKQLDCDVDADASQLHRVKYTQNSL